MPFLGGGRKGKNYSCDPLNLYKAPGKDLSSGSLFEKALGKNGNIKVSGIL